jgi:FHS family L-fucose permease-like MFS transporter
MEIGDGLTIKNESDYYRRARILVTSVFFMWGLSYGLLEVLNKHFQEMLSINRAQSGLLQTAYFGAYFLVALPAATFMRRTGYKNGLLLGLFLYALGALLFIPASFYGQFWPFLVALFVLASGLACLETAANPLMVELGEQSSASKRLNLAQSFCGLGCFLGPLLGGIFLFQNAFNSEASRSLESIRLIYAGLAGLVVLIAIYIKNTEILNDNKSLGKCSGPTLALFKSWSLLWGVTALFCYVAAQVGISALFINYVTEYGENLSSKQGAFLLSISLFIFTVGRFLSTWLMKYIKPEWLLRLYSLINLILCSFVIFGWKDFSVVALIGMFFGMSMMFPTIFSIAIKNSGPNTKSRSSILMMTMIGGAISPYSMGYIADHAEIRFAYVIPFFCFIVIFLYGHLVILNKFKK